MATLTGERAAAAARTRMRLRRLLADGLHYLVLSLLAVVFIFPFLWMVSTSFKVPGDELEYIPLPER